MNRKEWNKLIRAGKTKGIESLHNTADMLGKLDLADVKVFSFSFQKNGISNNDKITSLIEKENLPNKGKWVYAFCAENPSKLLKQFRDKKDKEKGKKFAQANDKVDKPSCVYVGSSNDKLKTRMAQHFGKAPVGTYAIRFNEWLPGGEEITCFYFEVQTQSRDVLQALENGLWDNLKPIIGKRGGK